MLCEGDGFTGATISYWQDGYIPGKLLSETAKSGADGIFPPPEQTFFLISCISTHENFTDMNYINALERLLSSSTEQGGSIVTPQKHLMDE